MQLKMQRNKKAKLDAWHDYKSMNVVVGRQNGRDNKACISN